MSRLPVILLRLCSAAFVSGLLHPVEANQTLFPRGGRQRRYLVFEKGGSFGVQLNIAKAIISLKPTGFNQIAEYTLNYNLPQTSHVWLPKELHRRPTTTSTTTKKPTTTVSTTKEQPWPYWQQTNRGELNYLPTTFFAHPQEGQTWQRHTENRAYLSGTSQKTKYPWCGGIGKTPKKYGRCKAANNRRRTRSNESLRRAEPWRSDEISENFFYDVLGKWAELHGFIDRYCVMRTLCESRYLLRPPGHSLFHDLVRIMVRFALPAAREHRVYKHSLDDQTTFKDCSRLYGPHCRLSFLEHFTNMIHHTLLDTAGGKRANK